ncbi:Uncharacterised protein [Lysinibacillus sphaericus]|nr:Uncharacterised protein [Lysinibacillus sphaericus]
MSYYYNSYLNVLKREFMLVIIASVLLGVTFLFGRVSQYLSLVVLWLILQLVNSLLIYAFHFQ